MPQSVRRLEEPVRVLLAEEAGLVRSGVQFALRTRRDVKILGEVVAPGDLPNVWSTLRPDIAVVGLPVAEPGGSLATINSLREILHMDSSALTIVLLDDDSPIDLLVDAICIGARGIITRSASAEAFRSAIDEVLAGGRAIDARLTGRLFEHIMCSSAGDRKYGPAREVSREVTGSLTRREMDVFRAIGEGMRTPEIATSLGLSCGTVKTHLRHIYRKLGVNNRTAAVLAGFSR